MGPEVLGLSSMSFCRSLNVPVGIESDYLGCYGLSDTEVLGYSVKYVNASSVNSKIGGQACTRLVTASRRVCCTVTFTFCRYNEVHPFRVTRSTNTLQHDTYTR
jgi:hypothetical protein